MCISRRIIRFDILSINQLLFPSNFSGMRQQATTSKFPENLAPTMVFVAGILLNTILRKSTIT